jgi:hypothetical protein
VTAYRPLWALQVIAHMMPDLPNVGWERDLESFREFFENPAFRSDGLKVGVFVHEPCTCEVIELGSQHGRSVGSCSVVVLPVQHNAIGWCAS